MNYSLLANEKVVILTNPTGDGDGDGDGDCDGDDDALTNPTGPLPTFPFMFFSVHSHIHTRPRALFEGVFLDTLTHIVDALSQEEAVEVAAVLAPEHGPCLCICWILLPTFYFLRQSDKIKFTLHIPLPQS